MQPKELALQLGIPAKKVRKVLRELRGTLKVQGAGNRWEIDEATAQQVIDRLTSPSPAPTAN